MASKYDSEDMLEDVLSIMTTGGALNAKIAEVEADKTAKGKGLSPALASIDSGAYFLQTWTDKILNANPAIFYGIENVESVSNAGAVAKLYTIFVEIILVDSGMTNDAWKRISRYSRALEELFATAFLQGIEKGYTKIEQVRPLAMRVSEDSSEEIKVGGISMSFTLY